MEFILYGLFFITGWLLHATYTYVIALGSSVVIYQKGIEDCLMLLAHIYEKYVTLQEGCYKMMRINGCTQEEIDTHRKLDKIHLENSMEVIIGNMIAVAPVRFRNLLNFKDWKSANIEITKIMINQSK
tara:strand:- start:718 stop:1101 length:384 start_codon:yes stop_codon:yes gene_type:complete